MENDEMGMDESAGRAPPEFLEQHRYLPCGPSKFVIVPSNGERHAHLSSSEERLVDPPLKTRDPGAQSITRIHGLTQGLEVLDAPENALRSERAARLPESRGHRARRKLHVQIRREAEVGERAESGSRVFQRNEEGWGGGGEAAARSGGEDREDKERSGGRVEGVI
ncbi:hypothetical protein KM043_005368 [Ampulex compressa]|nr:hypothetical protein KM043_005368 [Ampulex compressa]